MRKFIPNGILRYSPFFSDSIKNESLIKNTIRILNDYNYNKERNYTPIIYFGFIS